jgi:hypothetical protein
MGRGFAGSIAAEWLPTQAAKNAVWMRQGQLGFVGGMARRILQRGRVEMPMSEEEEG